MKRKKLIVSMVIFCIVALLGAAVFLGVSRKEHRIPYIAFRVSSTIEDGLYICSDGDIYGAISDVAIKLTPEELEKRIKENDYADILKFKGTTDADKVYKMHRLMCRVVLKEGYYILDKTIVGPNSGGYEDKVRSWLGYYYDENGDVELVRIYKSNSDKYCSDARAYIIVDWLYDSLKEYME